MYRNFLFFLQSDKANRIRFAGVDNRKVQTGLGAKKRGSQGNGRARKRKRIAGELAFQLSCITEEAASTPAAISRSCRSSRLKS